MTGKDDKDFNFDEWLADAELPEATVRVNKYGNLVAKLERLEQEHDVAKREESMRPPRRMSEKTVSEAGRIAEEMEKVREQLDSGWITLRLRGMTSAELERANKPKDADESAMRSIAIQSVEPKLTEAQVKALREKIGVGQFAQIIRTASEVAYGEVAVPDFSASVSATLATKVSSKS